MRRRRLSGPAIVTLLLLALACALFALGWSAGSSTTGWAEVPEQARSWLWLALFLVVVLVVRWLWRRIRGK
jgi:hypothetical protein